LSLPPEKVAITIDRFANTSSATIPITLDLLMDQKKIVDKDILLLTAVGGGLTWGTVLLEARLS
jgi:3-oxoacyl-[acyl-carrier-protein] synthase-3